MATLRNKRKLAAVTRETQEENPRNGQSRNTSVPRINEEYITQVSEEIEGRITKKLSQEFNRIESRISDALSKLDEFLSNQQIQTYSETVPGTFPNTNVENQGTNEDDSQSDPHPEGGLFRSQTTQNSGPEAGHYSFDWKSSTSVHLAHVHGYKVDRRSKLSFPLISKTKTADRDILTSFKSPKRLKFLRCHLNRRSKIFCSPKTALPLKYVATTASRVKRIFEATMQISTCY